MDVGTVNEWVNIAKEQQGGPDNCIAHFFMDAVPDKARSERENRRCFKEVEKVEIIIPGDKNNRPIHKVTDEHKARWPDAWAKFERTREEVYGDGTPIDQAPFLSKAQVLEFKALGVHTIESLAGIDDQNMDNLGSLGRKMRDKARQYVQPASDTEAELREALRTKDQQISDLMHRVETLERDAAGGAAPKPKRGRPKKDAEVGD